MDESGKRSAKDSTARSSAMGLSTNSFTRLASLGLGSKARSVQSDRLLTAKVEQNFQRVELTVVVMEPDLS